MKRSLLAVLAFLSISVWAKEYPVSVLKGGAEIVKSETGEQMVVSRNGMLAERDMLSLADGQQVAITIEKNAMVLLKGPANGAFSENGSILTITLDDGQLLLDRKAPYEFSAVMVVSKGFTFVPMGTCVAIKATPPATPTAAVLEGKVRMQNAAGETVIIEQGSFGSQSSDGKLATGALSPRAMESLNEWRAQAPPVGDGAVSAAVAAPLPIAAAPEPEQMVPASPLPAPKPTVTASPVVQPAAPAPQPATAQDAGAQAMKDEAASEQRNGAQKIDKTPPPPSSSKWEISAGTATIDDKQWTRIALGLDVPIWKFGIFFDVELFIDNEGQFSNKGWQFTEDDWLESVTRKIRYIRFGQEGEPLFVKLGRLSSVTMGYGFLVDRFTNMLHYPDQKLLGLQLDLNDLSPIGISLQTLVADFRDFDDDGGLAAARLGIKPLKVTEIPILKGLTVSASYARDINQFAPARRWDYTMKGDEYDLDEDGIQDSGSVRDIISISGVTWTNQMRRRFIAANRFDTIIEHRDEWAKRETDPFGLIGGDVSLPLITTNLVGLDLYGQAGMRDDGHRGWGIGAPGVSLKIWRLWANVEYRHVQGRFQPGYFGTYYLDERLLRDPEITTKEQRLADDTLNGVFGRLGFDIANVFVIDGAYQYMVGNDDASKDQRFEASGALGDLLVQKIPKLTKAEIYYYKSRIGNEKDEFFGETAFMYYGYRVGFAISDGASLIWDARYGFKHDENGKLVPSNNISVQTALTF